MLNRFSGLADFVGYGPKQPRFVFVGIEEYGDEKGCELNLQTRCSSFPEPLFDKEEACRLLAQAFRNAGQTDLAERCERALNPGYVRVWNFCAMIVAAVHGTDWLSEYETLGSAGGETLLTWLFPIPKPEVTYWPKTYQEWFGFNSYHSYYKAMWPLRKNSSSPPRKTLLSAVVLNELSAESVVVCYGKSFWKHYSDLLGVREEDWERVIPGRVECAVTSRGLRVVRTGFPFAGPSKSRVTEEHVAAIARELSCRPTLASTGRPASPSAR